MCVCVCVDKVCEMARLGHTAAVNGSDFSGWIPPVFIDQHCLPHHCIKTKASVGVLSVWA